MCVKVRLLRRRHYCGGGSRLVVVLEAKSRHFRRRRWGVPRGDHQAYLPVRRVFVFFPCPACPYRTKFGVPNVEPLGQNLWRTS